MELLTPSQKEALYLISKIDEFNKFYLAGGTALTIKYNHRVSQDFDFFTKEILNFEKIAQEIDIKFSIKWISRAKDTLHFLINTANNELVSISFFYYPYKLLKPLEYLAVYSLNLASDEDIACMKVIAITQRGSKKDFFDLWFLLKKNKWNLFILKNLVEEKYKNFPFWIFLKAVTFFEDAEKEEYSQDVIERNWQKIKDFFRKEVKKFYLTQI
ncbi:MAG: hypothetical protein DRP29_09535 [Thermodesulfobacteriota bacterium]|nr:MAG: hypothetical protein DRP29_09535 [Thermodesulfobacteriota bacterium]